jgi:flavin reductase (DIM6/NTAB) family NADH-FMN oxidoreductase RutF
MTSATSEVPASTEGAVGADGLLRADGLLGADGLLDTEASADPEGAVGAEALRAVMRRHAKGVAVITAGSGEAPPVGFCATSLTSVSLDPPLVSFTVGLRASAWPTVERSGHVAVHLLTAGQRELAGRFAASGAPRFGPATRWRRGPLGLPVLEDVLAVMVVAVVRILPAGENALVIGRVAQATTAPADVRPLLYHDGTFVTLA